MEKQPRKGSRGPRKAVADGQDRVEVSSGARAGDEHRQGSPSHVGPATWAEVEPILLKIEAERGYIGRIEIPFHGPEVYHRPFFGCPVVQGAQFTVLCCDGTTLVNPSA